MTICTILGGIGRGPRHWLGACVLAMAAIAGPAVASDHADTRQLSELKRDDAKIADFYAFTRGDRLVLVITVQAPLPKDLSQFRFPADVAYRFMIDRDAVIVPGEGDDARLFGGIISNPAAIKEDIVVEVRFGSAGHTLKVSGLSPGADQGVTFYAGVRDEPFIRSTRIGLNLAAIVVELPLSRVLSDPSNPVILTWATTDVDELGGPQDELGARAYRSMDPANDELNTTHPSLHLAQLGMRPDVIIFDTSRPAAFPNGRDLPDDVVDLLGRQDGAPFPSANDVPFLTTFPYLAPPHPSVAASGS
jgi:hypothetical protein